MDHPTIQAVARSLRKTGENYRSEYDPQYWAWRECVSDMCNTFATEYPGFDRRAFFLACGLLPASFES